MPPKSPSVTKTHRLFRYIKGICFSLLLTSPNLVAAQQILVYAEANAVDSRLVESSDGIHVEGFASDLVRELLTRAGYEADIRVVPWPRLMNSLQTEPNVLGFNMTRTPDREDQFHWVGQIRPVKFQLWGLQERIDELPRTLEEARDLRTSSYREDVVEQYLLEKGFTNLVYVTDTSDIWSMLLRRRIDLIPYIESGVQDLMSRLEEVRGALVPVIDLEEISTAHYLVMSKNSDPEFVQQLTAMFQTLVDSGSFESILDSTVPRPTGRSAP